MVVFIRLTGIRCGGALRSMQVMGIIRIVGVIGILIQGMAMDIQTILVRLWRVTPVTKEEEIIGETPVLGDPHSMEPQERYIMEDLDQLVEASIFLGHQAQEHN